MKNECKIMVRSNEKNNTITNLKKCDCLADFLVQEKDNIKKIIYADEVVLKRVIEQKCGKLPVTFGN